MRFLICPPTVAWAVICAIGMLVDAAVVMVENIVQRGRIYRWPGSSIAHHLPSGFAKWRCPLPSGILIIIIVFLPLLTLQGLEGNSSYAGGAVYRVLRWRVHCCCHLR